MSVEVDFSDGVAAYTITAKLMVFDEHQAAVVDQLLAHIQALTELYMLSPYPLRVAARELYGLPFGLDEPNAEVEEYNRDRFKQHLAAECTEIATTLIALQDTDVEDVARRQRLTVELHRRVPNLRYYFQYRKEPP